MVRPASRYLPALDGLRAVAVAAVIAFHLGRLRGGFLGVDVFFVVSGFLITRLLLTEREETGGVSLRDFWIRRFRRLVPALLVVLVAVALASRSWLEAWRISDIRTDALSALAYVANWRFVSSGESYFTSGLGPSPLRHTWSLAIEEQFYVLWPLLVVGTLALAARRRVDGRQAVGVLAAVIALASAAWMAVAAGGGGDLTRVYYGTDTRAFALCGGAWLATWWDPARRPAPARSQARQARRRVEERWAVAAAISIVPLGVLVVTTSEDALGAYQGAFQVAAFLSVVAVAGLATGRGLLARALGAAVPRWLGRRSYGIYLWSWPTQIFAEGRFGLSGWVLDLTVVGVTLALATLSFWLVEEPVRTGRPIAWPARPARPGRAPTPAVVPGGAAPTARPRRLVAATSSVVAVVGVLLVTAVGAPAKPAIYDVSDEEAVEAALSPESGFTPLPDDAPTSTTAPTPSTTATTAPTDPTVGAASTGGTTTSTTVPLPPGPFAADVSPVVLDPTADPEAVFGRPLRIMIAGDSVAWSLAWAASEPDFDPSVQLSNRALVGCGILPARAIRLLESGESKPYAAFCEESEAAQMLGLAERPDVVLLVVGAWEVLDHRLDGIRYKVGTKADLELVESHLQSRIDLFRQAGVPTVMPLTTCFGPSGEYTERLDPERIAWMNDRIRAVVARNRGWVRAVDPSAVLCNADGSERHLNPEGVVIRSDGAHFEANAGRWYWNTFLAGAVASAFDRTD